MNVSNTHSGTSRNICTEENGVFTNLVALSVHLSACLLVAICQLAQINSNHIYWKISVVQIRGTLVFSSVKLCIQYLHIVIRKILLPALTRPKNKKHEGRRKNLRYISKLILLLWQWQQRDLPRIWYKFTGPHGVTFPCHAALETPSSENKWFSLHIKRVRCENNYWHHKIITYFGKIILSGKRL